MKKKPILNISSGSTILIARILSNLYDYCPIVINGISYSSVEILLQMIKDEPESLKRKEILDLSGKNMGKKVKKLGNIVTEYVYWDERVIKYNSPEHKKLLRMFIQEKFYQNKKAMNALLRTVDYELVHNVGRESPYTSLPKNEFIEILIEIRDKELDLRKNMEE